MFYIHIFYVFFCVAINQKLCTIFQLNWYADGHAYVMHYDFGHILAAFWPAPKESF